MQCLCGAGVSRSDINNSSKLADVDYSLNRTFKASSLEADWKTFPLVQSAGYFNTKYCRGPRLQGEKKRELIFVECL